MSLAESFDVGEQGIHPHAYRLDASNTQAWMRPVFANMLDASILPPVADIIDMATFRENLRRVMARKGKKATTLSLAIGRSSSLIKDLLEKTDDVKLSTLVKLTSALDCSLEELLAAPRVAVVGYIGAGGHIIFEEFEDEETVSRPPSISGALEALIVRGDSMLPRYKDGDIIYIQKQTYEGLLADYLGEECAVRLVTGETYLKEIIKGSSEGRFTLLSLNAPPMVDVEVEWATPIAFVMPARSRLLFG